MDDRDPPIRSGPSEDQSPDTGHTLGGRLLAVYGIVTDYTGGLDGYRVKISDGDELVACAASEGGGLYGSRKHATYPLNTPVIVLLLRGLHEASPYGIILCSVPRMVSNEALYQADADVIGAPVGWKSDEVHKWEATQEPNRSSRKNFNNFVPIDGLTGEWGQYSPLGPAFHLGLAMAFMRATDRCGVWVLRQDELLRAAAKNIEIQTFARDYYDSFATGELLSVDSLAMYPWEGFGAFSPQAVAESDDQADPYAEDEQDLKLPLSPIEDTQRGIFRLRTMAGYAADCWQRFLTVPAGDGLDKLGENHLGFPGVFREALGADGSYLLQSAKSIALEKYLLLPYPIEERKPHDPQSDLVAEDDGNSTYYSSGYYAVRRQADDDIDKQPARRDFKPVADEETPELRPMIGLELHGFQTIETVKNLLRHTQNWYVPEEFESTWTTEGPAINIGPQFRLDPDRQWMPLPRVKEIDVDHRMPGVRYFASRAGLFVDDDGSIRIEDGYGSQLFMGGGNAVLSVPGDILTSAGRSIQQLAPKDIIQRAGRDIDITSSYGDLRLKAQYNLMAIGGVDGDRGGVLVESRNENSRDGFTYVPGTDADVGGLVLCNQQGAVSVIGQDLSLIAGYYQAGASDSKLLLQTRGSIHQLAANLQVDVTGAMDVFVGSRQDGEQDLDELVNRTLYQFGGSRARFVGVGANQQPALDVAGGVVARSLTSTGVSEVSAQEVDDLLSDSRETAYDDASDVYQQLLDARSSAGTVEEGQDTIDNYLNAQAADGVFGSLRTEDDYGTADSQSFMLWEFLWQRMARAAETDFSDRTWSEPAVSFPPSGDETAPWPGVGPWSQQARFRRQKTDVGDVFDWDAGETRQYVAEDEDPYSGMQLEEKKLSDSFLVNFKPTPR